MECLLLHRCPLYALGFETLLRSSFPDWELRIASSLEEAADVVHKARALYKGIVILDIQLCSEQGIEHLLHTLLAKNARVGIVLLGTPELSSASFHKTIPVDAFLTRECKARDIVQLLNDVSSIKSTTPETAYPIEEEGRHPPGMSVQEYVRQDPLADAAVNLPLLTKRQRELIDLLLDGRSNKQIASTLSLTYGTVKNYMLLLMRVFNVRSRLELVAKCRNLSYLDEAR